MTTSFTSFKKPLHVVLTALVLLLLSGCATCKYSFNDVSLPPEVKTFRVNQLENRARYVNTLLAPQLTEGLKRKIISTTRLQQTNSDDAHFDISGFVSDYSITTSGITANNATSNRLSVTFHLIFKNTLDDKKSFEADVMNNFDFSANQTLQQAESGLNDEIVKNTVDAVFNKIFSNW